LKRSRRRKINRKRERERERKRGWRKEERKRNKTWYQCSRCAGKFFNWVFMSLREKIHA
jgi:hypothetical protein